MLRISIQTAPPSVSSKEETNNLVFGNPSLVRLTLEGEEGDSGVITISGQDGSVLYKGTDVGTAKVDDGTQMVDVQHPFAPGVKAFVEFDPGESFGLLKTVSVRLEANAFGWYPDSMTIDDSVLAITYDGDFETFLTPTVNETEVELSSDVTVPGDEGAGADLTRHDLADQLLSIRPSDAVRITFNHAVDRNSFFPDRIDGRARSLSIRYMDDLNGKGLTSEVSAGGPNQAQGAVSTNWTDVRTARNLEAGTYYWERDDKSVVIAPPVGDWPYGRFVRFEFDRSLADGSGNRLKDDQDQVIYMMVAPEVEINITTPRKEVTYLPWESGDDEAGDPDDFYVTVSGNVIQKGAEEGAFIKEIHLTATNENEDSVGFMIDGYRIPGGATGHDTLVDSAGQVVLSDGKGQGSFWLPGTDPNAMARWSINLPLQHPDYAGSGAQAVAESRYKWKIEATAITDGDVRKMSHDVKVVYHEIFKPRVTRVAIAPAVGTSSGEVYRHEEGQDPVHTPLKLTAKDVGPKTFTVQLRGDFPDSKSFSYTNTYDVTLSNIFLSTDIDQSDDARQGEEEADTTLAPFKVDNSSEVVTTDGRPKNNTQHTLTFAAKTKANSRILFHLNYDVDTVPLDVVNAEAVAFTQGRGH